MKIDTMRKIDFFAGVPICFLLSLIFRLFSVLAHKKTSSNPQNVLMIELSEMGSAILADPAMRKLRSQFKANLHFVIFRKNKPSLDLLKTVTEENIFSIRENGFLPLTIDTIRFLIWTRRKNIDTVIDFELFSRFTAILTILSGAANRVGFHAFYNEGLYRGNLLTHKVAYNPHMHIAKNFIALVNSLSGLKKEKPYSKSIITNDEIMLCKAQITLEAKEAIRQKIKKYYQDFSSGNTTIVLVNSNASDLLPQRRWAQKKYITIIKKILVNFPQVLILLTGSPEEKNGIQVIADRINSPRCINFAGAVEFTELTTLYSISAFMLTNDSGPAHFASVTDLHTFVIFGPETPALYCSLGSTTPIYAGLACSPCVNAANHRKTPCTDNTCLQIITPDQVFKKIEEYLKQASILDANLHVRIQPLPKADSTVN